MPNQTMMSLVCEMATYDANELEHHGVTDQRWGFRYGPPYPLSRSARKIKRAEIKKVKEHEKKLAKMRKMAAKRRKEETKEKAEQERIEKLKKKLIDSGDIDAINKNSKYFTNEELKAAMERNRALVEMKYTKGTKGKNKASDPHALEKLTDTVQKVGAMATAAIPVTTLIKGIMDISEKSRNMKIKDMQERDKAAKDKIDQLMKFDPNMAAKYASRTLGVNVSYNPTKAKLSAKDKSEVADTLIKLMEKEERRSGTTSSRYKQLESLLEKISFSEEELK